MREDLGLAADDGPHDGAQQVRVSWSNVESLLINIDAVFRGYAFITFTTRDEALEAVKQVKLISKLLRNQLELIPFPFGDNQVGKLLLLNVSKVSEIFSLIPWR